MNFRHSDTNDEFRAEVTAFLASELGSVLRPTAEEDWDRNLEFCRALNRRGWVGMWWPKEYGGSEESYWRQLILLEEIAFWEAPRGPLYIGWDRVAWSLLLIGTEHQKRELLPAIQDVRHTWCQAFTEPGSGSDLASLTTTARRDGDVYVVNGQKTFNSYGGFATHALLAARTDQEAPKHKGISLFLLDMSLPGVTVRPLNDLRGHPHFYDIYLEDVRVPAESLLGEANRGWYSLTTTLDAERAGVAISRLGYCRRALAATLKLLPLVPDPRRRESARLAIADIAIGTEILRLLAYRVAWQQEGGIVPNVESSIAKLFGGELEQRAYQVAYNTFPELMQLTEGSPYTRMDGFVSDHLLGSVATTVAGGTSEVQRSVIANRGLGLPR